MHYLKDMNSITQKCYKSLIDFYLFPEGANKCIYKTLDFTFSFRRGIFSVNHIAFIP